MDSTTISSWALIVAKSLDDEGIDSKALFKQAGLNPAHLSDPNARYSFEGMTKLWDLAVKKTGDPCFGLGTIKNWHPTTFHALGYAWLASHTLKEAFQRLERYIRIVASNTHVSLTETSEGYLFKLEPIQPFTIVDPHYAAIDAGMATILHMCRLSCDKQLAPLRLELQRPAPECSQQFSEYFATNVQYGSDNNQFLFDKHHIEKLLPTSNAELARSNEKIVRDYLANMDRSDIVMQVKTKLTDNLTSGNVSEKQMADLLHMSTRSLQRKLEEKKQSYRNLLDETRQELAVEYVRDSNLSISEVTYLLGFSEASNFTRAFKRWTGQSPSQYRNTAIPK
jgi:AraC-like DNA-binding protein